MYVIGTAGHVDHGKSVLVHALTGIDPDRLPEEKRREMSIDLGFAWFKLPGGREVSIVDVPGHEKFIKNMLAGVGGIDLVLLIIAADEGVMPQTREHLAILDLLEIERGIAVITKKDLVDGEWLEMVTMEVEDLLKKSSLSKASILTVSALTGDGLPELISTIDKLLDATPHKEDIDRPRLPIDRTFSVKGFGTVVTGTLIGGKLSVGQDVEISVSKLKSHIRSLETHGQRVSVALPGTRVAINLAGISAEEIERGMVVTIPKWLKPTRFLDARLRAISHLPHPITNNMSVMVYIGTSEVSGKVRILDKDKIGPGESGWVQLRLSRPVAVAKGDYFVIRSPLGTLGGGKVVDCYPKRHSRFVSAVIEGLKIREEGSLRDTILNILEVNESSEFGGIVLRCHLSESDIRKEVRNLVEEGKIVPIGHEGQSQLLLSHNRWERIVGEASEVVADYHRLFPLYGGIPKEELRSQLGAPAKYSDLLLRRLIEERILVEEGLTIRLPSHKVSLSPKQETEISNFLRALAENPYSPPTNLSLDSELLKFLLDEGKVVKVSEEIVFDASAYKELVSQIVKYIKTHERVTVSEVRQFLHSSRKYILPVLQYLDSQKITVRVGDERMLKQ